MTLDLQDIFPDTHGQDEKSVRALFRALKNNFDANSFEYFRFKKSLSALKKLEMDAHTSYKSAFATAATMGLTKDKLLQSANKYLYVLEQERESFAAALLSRKKTKIDGKKNQVADYQRKIEEHKAKILELQREIEIFQSRIDNVDNDVETATSQMEGTKDRFLGVYNTIEKSIKADIETINKYL